MTEGYWYPVIKKSGIKNDNSLVIRCIKFVEEEKDDYKVGNIQAFNIK